MPHSSLSSYLTETSAHGLPRLLSPDRTTRWAWCAICGAIYGAAVLIVAFLTLKYGDPDEVVINMNLEDVELRETESGASTEASEVFPRMLLCLPDMKGIVEGFEGLRFWSKAESPFDENEEGLTSMTSSMRPTLFSPHLVYGRGYDSQYGVCSWISAAAVISVFWSDPSQTLDLYIRLTDEPSSPVNRLWKVALVPSMQLVKLTVFDVKLTTFYTGRDSNYTSTYPARVVGKIPFYSKAHCLDVCYQDLWFAETGGCPLRRMAMLNTIWTRDWKASSNSYCDWTRTLKDQSRTFPYSRICYTKKSYPCFAGNNSIERSKRLYDSCSSTCKSSHRLEEFKLRHRSLSEEEIRVSEFADHVDVNKTILSLEFRNLKLTRITQVPKMRLEDLFAQFGGYMGLLTGVSVITVLEFLEALVVSIAEVVAGCGRKKKEKKKEDEEEEEKGAAEGVRTVAWGLDEQLGKKDDAKF